MNIQEAILERHSVRQYIDKPIETEIVSKLNQEIENANREGGLHLQLVTNEKNAFGKGLAKYGKFSGINSYLALVAKKGLDENVGYYGERFVILAQSLGLNTCWVGLTFSKQPDFYTINEGEKLYCVISVGYGQNQGVQHPIKPIENFVKVNGQMPEWFKKGVESALLAPTAVNQQKFEFELVGSNTVKARAKFTIIGYGKIDLGIAKYHFEVSAGKENFSWA